MADVFNMKIKCLFAFHIDSGDFLSKKLHCFLLINLNTVCTILVEVKQAVWCWRSHTLSRQYLSLPSILVSALHV